MLKTNKSGGILQMKNDIQLYAWKSGVSVSTNNGKNLYGADNEQGSPMLIIVTPQRLYAETYLYYI